VVSDDCCGEQAGRIKAQTKRTIKIINRFFFPTIITSLALVKQDEKPIK
jgi:hypothetical protein